MRRENRAEYGLPPALAQPASTAPAWHASCKSRGKHIFHKGIPLNIISSNFLFVTVGLLSFACSAGDPPQAAPGDEASAEVIGSSREAVCENVTDTKAILASLAVATASEMRRWNAPVDFKWNSSSGMLEVSATGSARCYGRCRNVEALLALQKTTAHGTFAFPDGQLLDAYKLRGVLKHHYDRQTECNNWWGDFTTNGCWVEAHDLWFWKRAAGTCGVDNYFWADKAGSSSDLNVPQRLNYQLYFVGWPDNPYLNFRNNGSNVVIDPTVGLTEANTSASGSCSAVCSQYSTTSLVGQCCSCNGVTKTFSRSPFSYDMYLCR